MTSADEIQQALKPLVGLPLRSVGRAANLLWLQFGEMREVPMRHGSTKRVGDWAIHVQCAWRLCRGQCIYVSHRDFYSGPEGEALANWDEPGSSRFDRLANELGIELEAASLRVMRVATDNVGSFSLVFDREYRFDVFPDSSGNAEDMEHWRLFRPSSDEEHFVVP